MKKIAVLLLLPLLPLMTKALTYTATATGNWSTPATWTPAGIPGATDNAVINSGITVTLTATESISTLLIFGTFTVSGSNALAVKGSFTNDGTFNAASGGVTFNGSGTQFISGTHAITFNNLTKSGTSLVILSEPITVSGTFLLSSGTFDVNTLNYGLTVSGNFTKNGGVFVERNGTVTMNGSGAQTLGGSSSTTFYNLTKSGSGTTTLGVNTTVDGNVIISAGTLSLSTFTLTIDGNFTNNSTLTAGTGTVSMNGSAAQAINGSTATTFYNLTLASSNTVSMGKILTITNNLALNSGTLDATTGNYSINVGVNFTDNGGTFIPHGDTVTMNGSSAQTLGGTSTLTLDKLTIATGGTTTLGGNIIIDSNLIINSGATLDASTSNYSITIAGNWTDNGSFTCRSGLVTFDAIGSQCVLRPSGTEAFHNLTITRTSKLGTNCTVSAGGTVTLQPGGSMDCTCP